MGKLFSQSPSIVPVRRLQRVSCVLDMFVDMLLSGPVYKLGTLPSGRYSGDIPPAIFVSTS